MDTSPLLQLRTLHPLAYNKLLEAGLSPVTDDLMGGLLLESLPSAFVRVEADEGGFLFQGFLLKENAEDTGGFFEKRAGEGSSPEAVCTELVCTLRDLAQEAYLAGQVG